MSNELEILKSVDSENNITQRELAKRTGLSLGAVNVLIKRLIHKGLLKIEHINSKTIKYMLTPKGIMEKARLTYKYIVVSYNHILGIENRLESIVEKYEEQKICLHGEKDELFDIISSKLKSMNKKFKYITDRVGLEQYNNDEYVIITWNPDEMEGQTDLYTNIINILNQNEYQ